jgi:hypothetical protein
MLLRRIASQTAVAMAAIVIAHKIHATVPDSPHRSRLMPRPTPMPMPMLSRINPWIPRRQNSVERLIPKKQAYEHVGCGGDTDQVRGSQRRPVAPDQHGLLNGEQRDRGPDRHQHAAVLRCRDPRILRDINGV